MRRQPISILAVVIHGIRPGFQTVAAACAKIAGAQLDQQALTKAYAHVGVWAQENCAAK
jgi:hypothetical protein